jgi:hypothetical protein
VSLLKWKYRDRTPLYIVPTLRGATAGMVNYTKGQINTKEFVLESENIKPILDFLKKTGIGFAKEGRTKLR